MVLDLCFQFSTWKGCLSQLRDLLNLKSFYTFLLLFLCYKELAFRFKKLANVPVVGVPFPGYIGSWLGAIYFVFQGHKIIRHAYEKHKSFQVPMLERMLVFVSDPRVVDDLCNADPEDLSFLEAADDDFQIKYTMSSSVKESLWHIPIISDQLTKKLMTSLGEMRDEIHRAFEHVVNVKEGQDWTSAKAMESFTTIFARLANSFFVGIGLSRNDEFIENCVKHANDIALGGYYIRIWPRWFKPVIAKLTTGIFRRRQVALEFIEPLIKQRRDKMEKLGKQWKDRPNDFLQFLLDGSVLRNDDTMDIVLRLLFLNFAAIHTSAQMFCVALYQLITHPQLMDPLREEAVEMIARHGYTTVAFNKMSKIDSFLRESSRFISLGSIITTRKALIPYTFHDGTYIPKNGYVCTPHHSVHNDSSIYPEAYKFDPFRFHNTREQLRLKRPNENHEKVGQWTTTSPTQLFFGYGKHACPGRFFASMQFKMMLHYLLTTYDMKFTDPFSLPTPHRIQTMYIPNLFTKISFRYKPGEHPSHGPASDNEKVPEESPPRNATPPGPTEPTITRVFPSTLNLGRSIATEVPQIVA